MAGLLAVALLLLIVLLAERSRKSIVGQLAARGAS